MKIIELDKKYVFQTYKRNPVVIVKGKGQYVWDDKGKKYLDMFSGLSVCNLGHCHPRVTVAIEQQIKKLVHVSNLYYTEPSTLLAEKLINSSFPGKVFFSNSGAEANECAIKLARKYGNKRIADSGQRIENRYEIIVFKNSFHGRTLATLTATGQEKFHHGFEPLLPGFKYAEFNNLGSVKKLINNKTCAIMVEPIQGEGGLYPATKKFVRGLRKLCNQNRLLLIFDEIQCGMGRTGKLFAYQNYGVKPDIFTLAKSLANGLPIGATIARKETSELFVPGDHGSTFGANPISTAAALTVLKIMNRQFLNRVIVLGKYFISQLNELKNKYDFIKDVRGTGLMLAIELDFSGKDVVSACLENGLLINCTQDNVIRFLPSLITTKKDIDQTLDILEDVFLNLH